MTRINTVRIPGLATGMDTDSMIKQMLSGEQNKVDKAKQKQQSVKWQQEIYRAVIKDVKDLQDKYFSVTSKDSIITSKAWNSTKVSSSNDKVMTATGSAGANNVDYNFEVKHLAKPASTSSDKSTTGATIERKSKLNDLGLKEERKFTINFGKDGKDVSKEITINSDDTVDSLIAKINESTDGKVKASFSDMTGKLTIETNKTGESSKLSFISSKGSSTNPMDFLGLSDVPKGENAEIIVKSSEDKTFSKTLNEESNSFTIDGINYSVHAEGSADISSSQDVEPVVENMKKFVEDYNKIMDKVYNLVTEKKNKDFPPLTDAQKEDMKEEEIEKWEKKAKVGLLRNDSEMRTFMDHMQNAIFGENTKFLNECGLTSSEDYNKRGQISINEDKFRKALQNEGDRVYKAFAGNNNSVLEKMRKTMNNYVGGSSSIFARKAGLEKTSSAVKNYYSEQLKRQEDMIKNLQRKMDRREDQLYKQFGQLEASMNKLNSQMNYFAQA